jgi:hypothetical protein
MDNKMNVYEALNILISNAQHNKVRINMILEHLNGPGAPEAQPKAGSAAGVMGMLEGMAYIFDETERAITKLENVLGVNHGSSHASTEIGGIAARHK